MSHLESFLNPRKYVGEALEKRLHETSIEERFGFYLISLTLSGTSILHLLDSIPLRESIIFNS